MNVNMLAALLPRKALYNRTIYDKENEQMNRAIENHGITEFQSGK